MSYCVECGCSFDKLEGRRYKTLSGLHIHSEECLINYMKKHKVPELKIILDGHERLASNSEVLLLLNLMN